MYSVGKKKFQDLLDAIDNCKLRPNTIVTNNHRQVLMRHSRVSAETLRDISIAKVILELQKT